MCTAAVLLLAAAEEVSCQDSKGRQVSTDTRILTGMATRLTLG